MVFFEKAKRALFRCCHTLKLCLLNGKNPSLKDEGGGNQLCTLRSKTPHKGPLMFRSFHFSGGQVLCSLSQVLLLSAQALDKSVFWKAALPYTWTLYMLKVVSYSFSRMMTTMFHQFIVYIQSCSFNTVKDYNYTCDHCWCTFLSGTCCHDFWKFVAYCCMNSLFLAAN